MKRNSGFTLLEILVVISIIIILAGLLMPAISRANRQAKKAECMNNLRQIGMAIQQYALDNSGTYPAALEDLTTIPAGDPYLPADTTILQCPGDNTDYDYPGTGETTSTATATTPIANCLTATIHPGPSGTTYNVLYGDGHVGAPPAS